MDIRSEQTEGEMHIELKEAVDFIVSYLYNNLPRRRVDMFGQQLARHLTVKFSQHWYPDRPFKGSAYRCIRTRTEPSIVNSATESGLAIQEVLSCFPPDLDIWVDPGEVSYQSAGAPLTVIYSEPMQFSLKQNSLPAPPEVVQYQQHQQMTANMFARTKFGSTKLKAEKASRLTADELSAYVRQQAMKNSRGPRYDWQNSPLQLATPS
ncbi:unnamed protein product [Dimorphilus gyrociliatus]|uniref:Anti-proliferative protein domain-containing protein n=1 Tax=Dimorphilus gyrociliatus TaxID=2664684 RepID=A0A7I8VLB0_9ANNE|nr:unnamed protein product [Dimorphilus gyrociliatus]